MIKLPALGSVIVLTVPSSPAYLKLLSSVSWSRCAARAARARPDTGSTMTGAEQRRRSFMRLARAPSPPDPPDTTDTWGIVLDSTFEDLSRSYASACKKTFSYITT